MIEQGRSKRRRRSLGVGPTWKEGLWTPDSSTWNTRNFENDPLEPPTIVYEAQETNMHLEDNTLILDRHLVITLI